MPAPVEHPFGLLSLPAPHPSCKLIVTIPAKDETGYIRTTLDALRLQTDDRGRTLNADLYEVIVLANNCSDDTAERCRSYADRHPSFHLHVAERVFPPELACVGTVRRLLMDTAHDRFRVLGKADGIMVTSDADTQVAPDWIYQNARSFAEGAQVVGGRILVPLSAGRPGHYRKQHLLDVTYRSLQFCLESMIDPCEADPWPRHFQHFGPSTAVTAAAYAKCGGLPPLKCLEDVHFILALERADIPITHNPLVWVRTSSRISHRVDGRAFSEQLDEWSEMARRREEQRVPSLEDCIKLFKWKVALRKAYQKRSLAGNNGLAGLAQRLGWEEGELGRQILNTPSFGTVYQQVRGRLESDVQTTGVPISSAIRNLRAFTHSFRSRSSGIRPVGTDPLARYASA